MKERLTLARLKEILRARGFSIELKPDGSTSLRGRREEATPALMRAIAYWKGELIAELKTQTKKGENSGFTNQIGSVDTGIGRSQA